MSIYVLYTIPLMGSPHSKTMEQTRHTCRKPGIFHGRVRERNESKPVTLDCGSADATCSGLVTSRCFDVSRTSSKKLGPAPPSWDT